MIFGYFNVLRAFLMLMWSTYDHGARTLVLVGDRKGSISAFGRNFRFRLMPKHFGKISLSAERTFSAEMTHFCRNWGINGAGSNRNRGNFGRNNPLSAEIPSFGFFLLFRISYGWFLLSAEIAHSQTPSFGFGRNSFGRPLSYGLIMNFYVVFRIIVLIIDLFHQP